MDSCLHDCPLKRLHLAEWVSLAEGLERLESGLVENIKEMLSKGYKAALSSLPNYSA